MKKLAFFFLAATMAVGCKSKQAAASTNTSATTVSTHFDDAAGSKIKGNWKITNVSYPGSDYIKVTSFDIADTKCFIGSTWSFIPNNNKGNMALTSGNCPAFNTPIEWYINKEGQFVLKFVEAKMKAKNVKEGYVLRIANSTDKSFQLIDQINVGGQMTNVVYQFEKNI